MPAVDELRAMLPAWAAWSGVALYAGVFAIAAWAFAGFGNRWALARWRAAAALHWSQRNNAAAKVRGQTNGAVFGLTLGGIVLLVIPALHVSAVDHLGRYVLGLVLGFVIAMRFALRATSELQGKPYGWRDWLRSLGQNLLLLFYPLAVPFVAGFAIGPELGPWAPLAVAAAMALVAALYYGGSDWLLRRVGWLRPAREDVRREVERLAEAGGVTLRSVDEILTPTANAYAWPISRRAAVTAGLLDAATPEQVAAVLSHEMGHLTEPRWRWHLQFVLSLIGQAAPLASWRLALESDRPMAAIAVLVGLFIVINVIMLAMARRSEVHADRYAAQHGPSPIILGYALEAISRHNLLPLNLRRGVHPPTYQRLLDLGLQPDYPNPATPASHGARWFGIYTAACFVLLVVMQLGGSIAKTVLRGTSPETQLVAWATLGGNSDELCEIATAFEAAGGKKLSAITIWSAAEELDRQDSRVAPAMRSTTEDSSPDE